MNQGSNSNGSGWDSHMQKVTCMFELFKKTCYIE